MMHKNSSYKMEHSLNSGMAYKIEDNLQFDGVILSLEEGTEVIEGVENQRVRQKCNFKIKEHRTQVDYAKASKFLWTMVTNRFFKITSERRAFRPLHIGQTIRFTGMGAVKKADVLVMPITQEDSTLQLLEN
jgi:ribosomal protein S18